MRSIYLIIALTLITSCSSMGQRVPYFIVGLHSYMNDQVETIISSTTGYTCVDQNNKLADSCKYSGGGTLFRHSNDAYEFAKVLAGNQCSSGVATMIGYRKSSSYAGTTPVNCYSSKYSTSCYGGSAIYSDNSILVFKCKQTMDISMFPL